MGKESRSRPELLDLMQDDLLQKKQRLRELELARLKELLTGKEQEIDELRQMILKLEEKLLAMGVQPVQLVVLAEEPRAEAYHSMLASDRFLRETDPEVMLPARVEVIDQSEKRVILAVEDGIDMAGWKPGTVLYTNGSAKIEGPVERDGGPLFCEFGTFWDVREMLGSDTFLVADKNDQQRLLAVACPGAVEGSEVRIGDQVRVFGGMVFQVMPSDCGEADALFRAAAPASFDDLIGESVDLFKTTLLPAVQDLHRAIGQGRDNLKRYRIRLLVYGRKGNGKTESIKRLIYETGRIFGVPDDEPFVSVIQAADILTKWFGESGRRIKMVFDRAVEKAREGRVSLIYIQEIDDLVPADSDNHSEMVRRTVSNNLQTILEGYASLPANLIVVADCNRLHEVKSEMLDRFNHKLEFRPDFSPEALDRFFEMVLSREAASGVDDLPGMVSTFYRVFRTLDQGVLKFADRNDRALNSGDFWSFRNLENVLLRSVTLAERQERPVTVTDVLTEYHRMDESIKQGLIHTPYRSNLRDFIDLAPEEYRGITAVVTRPRTLEEVLEFAGVQQSEWMDPV